ncbi:MAG: metallophosphoesterase family protein [Planctomycetes bacterium]|nr:metallophosphoesterase family protein [Planctomycetota bacterium]
MHRIALFGGIYNNYLALAAALDDAHRRRVDAIYCLGDMGAFGPHPERVFPLLREHNVQCIQGNYDHSVGNGLSDCQCGYTDPRDNHFARLSYAYTFANTSLANREWLRALPAQMRVQLGPNRVLLCHGSPRRTNEFLWESTCSSAFLEHLLQTYEADIVCTTHTGIKWDRPFANERHFVNVGVLGRPENDGTTNVWYTILSARGAGGSPAHERAGEPPAPRVEFVPVRYDHERLAAEMRAEKLPAEFVETVLTGWWTTCLEVLPAKERRRGRF